MSMYFPHLGVTVDGGGLSSADQRRYEARISNMLTLLFTFAVPRAIFRKIIAHGEVEIVPWSADDASKYGACNATGAQPGDDWPELRAGFVDVPGRATVHYSPDTWMTGSCASGPGSKPEEILLHELVHSARFTGRDFDQKALTGSMKGYDNEEEFFAVMVTNIYTSETGATSLRADHSGFSNLSALLTKPEEFLRMPENYRLVKKFCSQHPNIAPMIATANAAFNPVKLFYEWKAKDFEPDPIQWFADQGRMR